MDQIRGFQMCRGALGPNEAPPTRDLVTPDMGGKLRISINRNPNGVNFKCNDHVMEKLDDRPMTKCDPDYLNPREHKGFGRQLRSGTDCDTTNLPSRGYFTDTERVYQKMHRAEYGEHKPMTRNSNTLLPHPAVRARDPLARQFDALMLLMPQHLSKDTEMPESMKQRVVLDPGVQRPTVPKVGTNPHKEQVVRGPRIRGSQPEDEHTPVQVAPHVLTRQHPDRSQITNSSFAHQHRAPLLSERREGALGGDAAPYLVAPTRVRPMDRPNVFCPIPETRKKGKSISSMVT